MPARTLAEILRKDGAAHDRRSETSRANLEQYIPAPLDPDGTIVISARLPVSLIESLDRARGDRTRSEYLRELLQDALTGGRCASPGTRSSRPTSEEGHA